MNELERAVMESARFAAMESYFEARPQIAITRKLECVFEAGFDAAYAEVRRLRGEVDQLRCQLAGCGVAALENTVSSRSRRAVRGDYGHSASYEDVCNAVDREIALREENERLSNTMERCYRMLLTDDDTRAALFKAEDMLRESLAARSAK